MPRLSARNILMTICFLAAGYCLIQSIFWHVMAALPGLYGLTWGKISGLLLIAEIISLALFFKWPIALLTFTTLRLALSAFRFFPWDGAGPKAFTTQHAWTLALFFVTISATFISLMPDRPQLHPRSSTT
ncbi:hypothetical protein [Granulicella sp. L46]|jgi:hypothetical protein|uniref:hypothetical protein n=1 Tax=Granulicella sp. L46 TaxID=1641865 RepID=UPI00131D411E|nr:hypothetical protein [Granulicella sp. L46]